MAFGSPYSEDRAIRRVIRDVFRGADTGPVRPQDQRDKSSPISMPFVLLSPLRSPWIRPERPWPVAA